MRRAKGPSVAGRARNHSRAPECSAPMCKLMITNHSRQECRKKLPVSTKSDQAKPISSDTLTPIVQQGLRPADDFQPIDYMRTGQGNSFHAALAEVIVSRTIRRAGNDGI